MTNEMEQRVEPHNDYFSTQFLLNFVILGTHNITVESSVIDSNGIVWKTGPKTTIFVKSLEDPYSQQVRLQQQQGQPPSQQQQQRTAYSRFWFPEVTLSWSTGVEAFLGHFFNIFGTLFIITFS